MSRRRPVIAPRAWLLARSKPQPEAHFAAVTFPDFSPLTTHPPPIAIARAAFGPDGSPAGAVARHVYEFRNRLRFVELLCIEMFPHRHGQKLGCLPVNLLYWWKVAHKGLERVGGAWLIATSTAVITVDCSGGLGQLVLFGDVAVFISGGWL